MNKARIVLAVFVGALTQYSCNNTEKPTTQAATHKEHQHHDAEVAIELNNGEKWEVNAEMIPFIVASEQILNDYTKANDTDYVSLASQLKEKNTSLIKSCTMNGKSHDELHKWLHPHIELIDSLGKAENEEQARIIISNLQVSFQTYNMYFK